MANKLMCILNDDTQNYPFCRLELVETLGHSTQHIKLELVKTLEHSTQHINQSEFNKVSIQSC